MTSLLNPIQRLVTSLGRARNFVMPGAKKQTEWRLIFWSLLLASTALGSVHLLSARINQAIDSRVVTLQGADLILNSNTPVRVENQLAPMFSTEITQALADSGLRTSKVVRLQAMLQPVVASDTNATVPTDSLTASDSPASSQSRPQLVALSALDSAFPLKGQITFLTPPNPPTLQQPKAGTLWVDAALAQRMQLTINQRLRLGEAQFTVAAILSPDNDARPEATVFAPAVWMTQSDLTATELIVPGSRVRERLLLAGDATAIARFETLAKPTLRADQQFSSGIARGDRSAALNEQGQRFFGLVALLSVLLTVAVLLLSLQALLTQVAQETALLRAFGVAYQRLIGRYLSQLLRVGVIASALGLIAALGLQQLLSITLKGISGDQLVPLTQLSWQPFATTLIVPVALLLLLALPGMLQLRHISPLQVMRQDIKPLRSWVLYLCATLAFVALIVWQTKFTFMALISIGVLFGLFALLGGLCYGLIRALPTHWRQPAIALGVAHIKRYPLLVILQVSALALGILFLLTLWLISTQLINSWRATIPDNAPNRFVTNINAGNIAPLNQLFEQAQLPTPTLYPSARARLIEVNQTPVEKIKADSEWGKRLLEREFVIGFADELPANNTIQAGDWFAPTAPNKAASSTVASDTPEAADDWQFSIDQDVADELKLALGDQLIFFLDGRKTRGTITSLREIKWNSFTPNFFVLAPAHYLAPESASYLGSFYLAEKNLAFENQLLDVLPHLSLIDVTQIIRQVTRLLDQLVRALSLLMVLALISGALVISATWLLVQKSRQKEAALWRTLGATKAQLRATLLTEMIIIGLFASVIAGTCANALIWVLARYVLDIPFTLNAGLWLLSALIAMLFALIAGLRTVRQVSTTAPLMILRS